MRRLLNDGWAKNTTVYYTFNNIPLEQQTQIKNATNSWNTANQNNGSGVRFLPSDTNHPATLTFQTSSATSSVAANTISTHHPTTGATTSAVVTFYSQSTFSNGAPMYSPNLPGYNTFYQKIALHEIGHTMGLDHPGFPNPGILAEASKLARL